MKYIALCNIATKPPIAAGEEFDGKRLINPKTFLSAGQIVAVKEVKTEEVKQDGN